MKAVLISKRMSGLSSDVTTIVTRTEIAGADDSDYTKYTRMYFKLDGNSLGRLGIHVETKSSTINRFC